MVILFCADTGKNMVQNFLHRKWYNLDLIYCIISKTLSNTADMSADQHHLSPLTGLTWGLSPVTARPGAADQQEQPDAPQPDRVHLSLNKHFFTSHSPRRWISNSVLKLKQSLSLGFTLILLTFYIFLAIGTNLNKDGCCCFFNLDWWINVGQELCKTNFISFFWKLFSRAGYTRDTANSHDDNDCCWNLFTLTYRHFLLAFLHSVCASVHVLSLTPAIYSF